MRRTIFAIAATVLAAAGAVAQTYPTRPITISVPYAAGGPLDTMVRIVAEAMRAPLGQPAVVENVAGAGGSIGVGRVTRAPPDGYTLGAGNWASHVANVAIYSLPYDVLKDLAPISLLPIQSDLILARRDFPAANLTELIAWLKANPDKAVAGTSGIGGPSYMSSLFFQQRTGTQFRLIPYRGSGPAMLDLVSGQLDIMITAPDIALPQVRDGRIKAFAVTARTRLPEAPDIPTTDQAGLPGFYFAAWTALWAPKGTPKAIITKLSDAVRDVLADPQTRRKLEALAIEIPEPDQLGPDALAAFHRAEIEKWVPIIKAANIRPE
jgi:tripartite-type tricarboxylate transporter receptor subunit TctC